MRTIVVDNKKFQYFVGRGNVVICASDGSKQVVSIHTVKGVTPDTFERGQWKKTSDGMLRPKEVAQFIRRNSSGT